MRSEKGYDRFSYFVEEGESFSEFLIDCFEGCGDFCVVVFILF